MLQYFTPDILLFFAGQRTGYIIGETFGNYMHALVSDAMCQQISTRFGCDMHVIRSRVPSILVPR